MKTSASSVVILAFVASTMLTGYANARPVRSKSQSINRSGFDIANLMGKRMADVKQIMRPYKSLGQGQNSNDPEDDWPGDTTLNYEWYNSNSMITIVCDRRTRRVVFCNVADQNPGGLHANLNDWRTILPRFGMSAGQAPDDLHPAYTVWHNYHGRYYVHIYGHSPDRQVWAIEMAKTGEHYSGERD